MYPLLFEYDATDFSTFGFGELIDCTECIAVIDAEGEYELSFSYPVTGPLFQELTIGRLIYAKANSWQGNQIFRIYGYSKEINGLITINCEHISYDLNRIPVRAFTIDKPESGHIQASQVIEKLTSNAVKISGLNISKFTITTDITDEPQNIDKNFKIEAPSTARNILLDGDESIIGTFGGDLVLDNYSVTLKKTAGEDRGASIEYGVNLIDLEQEENISEMVTGVYPYIQYTTKSGEAKIRYGTKVCYASGDFRTHRVKPLDLTEYFEDYVPEKDNLASREDIDKKAEEWVKESTIGEPEVSLTINYADINKDVRLHDAVTVRFVKMGIDVKAKVTKYTYDVLQERCTEIEVGKTKKSILFSLEDASRLRKGLLPPSRIKDKSLTSEKYGNGSVGGSSISTNGVSSYHIKDEAITSEKIEDEAVITKKLADAGITNEKVKDKVLALMKMDQDFQDNWTTISNLVVNHIVATYAGAVAGDFDMLKIGNNFAYWCDQTVVTGVTVNFTAKTCTPITTTIHYLGWTSGGTV